MSSSSQKHSQPASSSSSCSTGRNPRGSSIGTSNERSRANNATESPLPRSGPASSRGSSPHEDPQLRIVSTNPWVAFKGDTPIDVRGRPLPRGRWLHCATDIVQAKPGCSSDGKVVLDVECRFIDHAGGDPDIEYRHDPTCPGFVDADEAALMHPPIPNYTTSNCIGANTRTGAQWLREFCTPSHGIGAQHVRHYASPHNADARYSLLRGAWHRKWDPAWPGRKAPYDSQ